MDLQVWLERKALKIEADIFPVGTWQDIAGRAEKYPHPFSVEGDIGWKRKAISPGNDKLTLKGYYS